MSPIGVAPATRSPHPKVTPMPQPPTDDPHNLHRFLSAQATIYADALQELRHGRKQSHWIWFIFPQMLGLAPSPTSQHYGIRSIEEARAYLHHPVLGPRLRECCQALLAIENKSAYEILGNPDHLKVCSCMTLFALVAGTETVFTDVLSKYFVGKQDPRTRSLLNIQN